MEPPPAKKAKQAEGPAPANPAEGPAPDAFSRWVVVKESGVPTVPPPPAFDDPDA